MRKAIAIGTIGLFSLGLMGCEPVETACNDVQKFSAAVSKVETQHPETKEEMLDEVGEMGNAYYCPGYEESGDTE